MSPPGVEPGLRPSQGRVRIRHTPGTTCRDRPIPRPGVEPGLAVSKTAVRPPHPRGFQGLSRYPRQESNLVCDLRSVACASGTLQGQSSKAASPTGFEPVISTVTKWRALRTAPRRQCNGYVHSDGPGGIRTLSISRSEREWSAGCLPGRSLQLQEPNTGGWNRTSGLHVQSVASRPTATAPV